MAIGCSARCAKAVLITFNLVFWLSGCALLALGVWLLLDPVKSYLFQLVAIEAAGDDVRCYLAYALIGLGGLVLIVGFFGCCGALQESKCMLITYFIFLFLIFCAELAIAILPIIYRDRFLENLENTLVRKLRSDYDKEDQIGFTTAMNYVQYKFQCCGVRDSHDYFNSQWANRTMARGSRLRVPTTCCRLLEEQDPSKAQPWTNPEVENLEDCQNSDPATFDTNRHEEGCLVKVRDWAKMESTILMAAGIGVAALEILGMVFSICLCRNIGEEV